MLTDIVAAGTKALGGARFSLVNILPGTVFASIVVLAALSGAYSSGEPGLQQLQDAVKAWDTPGAVLLVFGLFVAGVLLQPFQVALVQVLEGYWQRRPLRTFSAVAIERHRRRMRTAEVQKDIQAPVVVAADLRASADLARARALAARRAERADAVLARYPVRIERVLPTTLGNVLRSGEDAAGDRYGLDALSLYPRMYPVISKPLLDAMARQLDLIALTASLTVSSTAAAVATVPLLVIHPHTLWAGLPVLAALLAMISYRGSLRAASDHGLLFATTFDLHRFDMIRALHFALPETFAEERELNRELTGFFQARHLPLPALAARPFDHSIYDKPTAPTVDHAGGGEDQSGPDEANAGERNAGEE